MPITDGHYEWECAQCVVGPRVRTLKANLPLTTANRERWGLPLPTSAFAVFKLLCACRQRASALAPPPHRLVPHSGFAVCGKCIADRLAPRVHVIKKMCTFALQKTSVPPLSNPPCSIPSACKYEGTVSLEDSWKKISVVSE